jgi:ribosome biogenesis GTPase / thiamine phosphate phosphatase
MEAAKDIPEDSAMRTDTGLVLRSTGSWYDVRVGEQVVHSKVRGRFRLEDHDQTNPVVVGDKVTIRRIDDGTGLITEIHKRKNRLSRRAAGRRVGMEQVIAANIDRAWCVQSIRMPKINTGFIDRFLVMAEVEDIPGGIILNKHDLMKDADRDAVHFIRDLYEELGYPVQFTSVPRKEGMEELRAQLNDRISLLAGPSGVGKSSLLNELHPSLSVKTGDVSAKTQKGRHTTTFATLYEIEGGGFVVDTPGIREFGIWDLSPEDLSSFFVEMRALLPECYYPSCTHDHEPDCAVKEAVERDEITIERYESYMNILKSLRLGEKDVGR